MLMRKLMTLVTVMMMTIIATRPVVMGTIEMTMLADKSSASSTTVDGQNPALPIIRNIP